MSAHVYFTPADHDPCPEEGSCWLCDGGLGSCKNCSGTEGTLTTECPGAIYPEGYADKVYRGLLDFRGGRWIENVLTIHMGGAPA